jgi:hypothetical protein
VQIELQLRREGRGQIFDHADYLGGVARKESKGVPQKMQKRPANHGRHL